MTQTHNPNTQHDTKTKSVTDKQHNVSTQLKKHTARQTHYTTDTQNPTQTYYTTNTLHNTTQTRYRTKTHNMTNTLHNTTQTRCRTQTHNMTNTQHDTHTKNDQNTT